MHRFNECFYGGFFGIGRWYGAVASFECASIEGLEREWPEMLRAAGEWRAARGDRARALHLRMPVPTAVAHDAMAVLAARLLEWRPPLPREPRRLHLEAAVFATPDMTIYIDLRLEPEATDERADGPNAASP